MKKILTVVLDEKQVAYFAEGKEKSGLKSDAEFIRFLIARFAHEKV